MFSSLLCVPLGVSYFANAVYVIIISLPYKAIHYKKPSCKERTKYIWFTEPQVLRYGHSYCPSCLPAD